jgi:hypothetical protein
MHSPLATTPTSTSGNTNTQCNVKKIFDVLTKKNISRPGSSKLVQTEAVGASSDSLKNKFTFNVPKDNSILWKSSDNIKSDIQPKIIFSNDKLNKNIQNQNYKKEDDNQKVLKRNESFHD